MSTQYSSFFDANELALSERFLDEGYVIIPAENREDLDHIRDLAAGIATDHLGLDAVRDSAALLDGIADNVDASGLNDLRSAVINTMNAEAWLRPAYFGLARAALSAIVGNELVMQRRINLSIQIPGDDSSLLPVHADVWSGDSPFEVVLWVPLVDCYGTKTMFLLPPAKDRPVQERLSSFAGKSADDLFSAIEPDIKWMEVPYGHVLLFSQTLMHGNRINEENEARWTMNCRFKSVFSPYASKKLGEFFEPVTLRAASRLAFEYDLPEGFDD
jgi:sporadic carbohydrate cluster 2OG-Fe(II) oxygenase